MFMHSPSLNGGSVSETGALMSDGRAAVVAKDSSDSVATKGGRLVFPNGFTNNVEISVLYEDVGRVSSTGSTLAVLDDRSSVAWLLN